MGNKNQTSTQNQDTQSKQKAKTKQQQQQSATWGPTQQVADYNTGLMDQIQQTSATPFQSYNGELVAGVNPYQQNVYNNIAGMQENAGQYYDMAGNLISNGSSVSPQQWSKEAIDQYYNPYHERVVDATMANISNLNAEQRNAMQGNQAQWGLGGDRAGVGKAELARQQGLVNNQTLADLEYGGWNNANTLFGQQQGVDMQAQLANQQAELQRAGLATNLGQAQQGTDVAAAQLGLQAGKEQQQTQQFMDDAQYAQFLREQKYPFETTQWAVANSVPVTGQMGGVSQSQGTSKGTTNTTGSTTGTTTTTTPGPSPISQIAGLGIAGLGAASGLGWAPLASQATSTLGSAHGGRVGYDSGGMVPQDFSSPTWNPIERPMATQRSGVLDGVGRGAPMQGWDATTRKAGPTWMDMMREKEMNQSRDRGWEMANMGLGIMGGQMPDMAQMGKTIGGAYNHMTNPYSFAANRPDSNPVRSMMQANRDTGMSDGGVARRGYAGGGVPGIGYIPGMPQVDMFAPDPDFAQTGNAGLMPTDFNPGAYFPKTDDQTQSEPSRLGPMETMGHEGGAQQVPQDDMAGLTGPVDYSGIYNQIYGKKDNDKWSDGRMALILGGLGIAAGQSPNALSNIGAGGLMGAKYLAERKGDRSEHEANAFKLALAQRSADLEAGRLKESMGQNKIAQQDRAARQRGYDKRTGIMEKAADPAQIAKIAQARKLVPQPQAKSQLEAAKAPLVALKEKVRSLHDNPEIARITGFHGARPTIPNTEPARMETTLEEIKSRLSVAALTAMREASKTGGAVGNVTEKEWPILESQIAKLDPVRQGKDGFKTALQEVITSIEGTVGRMQTAFDETYAAGSEAAPIMTDPDAGDELDFSE